MVGTVRFFMIPPRDMIHGKSYSVELRQKEYCLCFVEVCDAQILLNKENRYFDFVVVLIDGKKIMCFKLNMMGIFIQLFFTKGLQIRT